MTSDLKALAARVAAGKVTELERTELLVRTVKAAAEAAVTNRLTGANEQLGQTPKLEHRLDALRQVERIVGAAASRYVLTAADVGKARCARITGATSTSYRVIETGKGSRLRAVITAKNPIRSSTAPLGPAA